MIKKSYKSMQDKLKNMEISDKKKLKLNIYKILKEIPNIEAYDANIKSFCSKNTPSKLRIRSDSFLKNIKNDNANLNSYLLCSTFKNLNDGEVYVFILSLFWFKKYKYSINSSNSFINFNFSDLTNWIKTTGMQYKFFKKRNGKEPFKYTFLLIKDKEITKEKLKEYINFSTVISGKKEDLNLFAEKENSIDPKIPKNTKSELYNFTKNSCIVHKNNKNSCRTKIDWQETHKSLKGTNLHVPLDFHHFITRKMFKEAWLNSNFNLNWEFIHSKKNLIPLCKICHQSIHNENKDLVKETFNNIVKSLKNEKIYNIFNEYLIESKLFKNIEDLLKKYQEK